ncbi:MAG: hypothetical protein R3Y13_05535 [bacterium]
MDRDQLEILLSNYITIYNQPNSEIFLKTTEQKDVDTAIGKSVINYMRRRKIDDVIHDIEKLVNDIKDLEDVYENVDGFVWNDELITPEIYKEKVRSRILHSDEAYFLRTKEAEISYLIQLLQLKSQYATIEKDELYSQKRDEILSKLIDCRAKFVFYKQNLTKTSLETGVSLNIDKFKECGIHFKENIRNDDTSLKIDYRDYKNVVSRLHSKGILLSNLSEDQKEVVSIEVLSPAFFTNIKDKQMMDSKYGYAKAAVR